MFLLTGQRGPVYFIVMATSDAKGKDCVVVTGSSTGIGLACVQMLAKNGFQVLAGVRTLEDQVRIEDMNQNIHCFILDVTKPESLQKAFAEIESALSQADRVSLVNNAGITMPGPMEGLRSKDLRLQFDVNFFGLIEWTQLLLPLIRRTRGKILNMSSISGLVVSPFLGAYAASKFAMEAASDALRRELLRFGVEVILIEPGPVRTPIWAKGMEKQTRMEEMLRPGTAELYEKEIFRVVEKVTLTTEKALPAEDVATVVLKCLKRKLNPARIMVVSPRVWLQIKIVQWAPTKWMDKALSKFFYR